MLLIVFCCCTENNNNNESRKVNGYFEITPINKKQKNEKETKIEEYFLWTTLLFKYHLCVEFFFCFHI